MEFMGCFPSDRWGCWDYASLHPSLQNNPAYGLGVGLAAGQLAPGIALLAGDEFGWFAKPSASAHAMA